jgi:hypothetical protein
MVKFKPAEVHLEDIASQAGLTALNVYGGDTHKEFIIETTGNGAVIFDYDNDGWPDIFLPRTGSRGISILLSFAWSRKFKPMQTILLGLAIGGPSRAVESACGADEPFCCNHRSSRARPSLAKRRSS